MNWVQGTSRVTFYNVGLFNNFVLNQYFVKSLVTCPRRLVTHCQILRQSDIIYYNNSINPETPEFSRF